MGGSISPNTTQRVSYEESPYQKWLRGVITNPNSAVSLGLKDAAQQAKLAMGVKAGDPEALKKFWGYQPTKEDFAAMQRGSTDFYRGVSQASKNTSGTKTAAHGGLMSVRRFASGGKALTDDQATFVQDMAKKVNSGGALTEKEITRLNKIETDTGKNVSPYTNTGTIDPGNAAVAKAATSLSKAYTQAQANPPGEGQLSYSPSQAMFGTVAGYDPTQKAYGGITNEFGQKAIDMAMGMQLPEEYGQASNIYNQAAAGLQGLAGYTPQNVSAQSASAQQAKAQMAQAAQMGQIADVNAERGSAAQMGRIADVAARAGTAAQMGQVADVGAERTTAERIAGAQMQRPEDVQAQQLQRYLMGATAPVTTQDLQAYQMAGPGSWTEEGVSSKYMSPYMQGVIDISKREAARDYQKQINELNAKAVGAKAFGGSRQALERAEAARNYEQRLQDLQVQGLQQAYESGRSQYGQELGLSQQAALNNLQSKLSTQSQSSQEALQAMLSNQNIDYQTKVQNLQSMLGVQSQEAQQMLNAALANQQTGLSTNQQNLQAEMQKQLANQQYGMTSQQANQQAALQAALANQQTAYGTGQFNAGNQQAMALANMQQELQAALANQQTALSTGQFNAANEQAMRIQNIQNALQAALANQQTQFGVGSLNANLANQTALQNAQLGTQASLTNAQLGTQTSLANAQNALNASIANQSAGLQGNQQNIAALSASGNMAGGLGTIGGSKLAGQQQILGNVAQIYNTTDAKAQQWANTQQQNAINQQMGVQNAAKFGIPSGAPMVTGGGAQVSQGQV